MPEDMLNKNKDNKGYGGFDYKKNFITDNFIYTEPEATSLERDDVISRAKEELLNADFPSNGVKYADRTNADYDEKEDIWRITLTDTSAHAYDDITQYTAYMTGKGKTMYLLYTKYEG
jgi:hypothetical protein